MPLPLGDKSLYLQEGADLGTGLRIGYIPEFGIDFASLIRQGVVAIHLVVGRYLNGHVFDQIKPDSRHALLKRGNRYKRRFVHFFLPMPLAFS